MRALAGVCLYRHPEGTIRVRRYPGRPAWTEDPVVVPVVDPVTGGQLVLQPEAGPGQAGV